ncbi:MarR family winged helix-turn-helix transcriptional regulator [Plastoroseomonas hellenica]|uniref:MarR family winged helix-turn-helix transcriptional regulator n=1 Tax=Plastoroseomonas hellenica TaxID=2687306 RepID=UPI001BA9FECB|nr:MarR family winged helix-turn-helix transcriptional regulator [Plastoroseomonas hellenica]
MPASRKEAEPGRCNNTALRKAARHVTRFYDGCMAESGLRTTQYAILNLLADRGPMTMAALAGLLVMDRATMGHNLRPLERDGLITIEVGRSDRREREVSLTDFGRQREAEGKTLWLKAQRRFEQAFGAEDAKAMRRVMARIAAMELDVQGVMT